jgi:hypothetical protein
MKTACIGTVVGLWIYSVFLLARWRIAAQYHEENKARLLAQGWIRLYLKLSGLLVLAWLVLIIE